MRCTSLSPSRIKTYSQCNFKYYLNYCKKLDLGTNFGALQGSLCHIIYEKFAISKRDEIEKPEIKNNWVDLILGAYRENPENSPLEKKETGIWKFSKKALRREKECTSCEFFERGKCFITDQDIEDFIGCPVREFQEAVGMIKAIIDDATPKNPLNKKIIDVENKFEENIDVDGEKVPINGILDITTELDKDTVEITDYKTGNWIQSYEKCLQDPQLLIYHLAARHIYSQYKYVLLTIYYLKRAPMTFAFLPEDEHRTKKSLLRFWKKIRNDKCPKRRCDKPSGAVYFDHVCKNLCNVEICKREHKKFIEQGGIILPEEDHD